MTGLVLQEYCKAIEAECDARSNQHRLKMIDDILERLSRKYKHSSPEFKLTEQGLLKMNYPEVDALWSMVFSSIVA